MGMAGNSDAASVITDPWGQQMDSQKGPDLFLSVFSQRKWQHGIHKQKALS